MDCKCCGNWFGSASESEICSICERAIQRVSKYLSTIGPIRAAGGCYCRECKHCKGADNNQALTCGLNSVGIQTGLAFITPDDFCSYGEPREAQDNELT